MWYKKRHQHQRWCWCEIRKPTLELLLYFRMDCTTSPPPTSSASLKQQLLPLMLANEFFLLESYLSKTFDLVNTSWRSQTNLKSWIFSDQSLLVVPHSIPAIWPFSDQNTLLADDFVSPVDQDSNLPSFYLCPNHRTFCFSAISF